MSVDVNVIIAVVAELNLADVVGTDLASLAGVMGRRQREFFAYAAALLLARAAVEGASSARVLFTVASAGTYRSVEPRLSVEVPYRAFEERNTSRFAEIIHDDPRLLVGIGRLINVTSTSSPEARRMAGLTFLLVGKWNGAINQLAQSDDAADRCDLAAAYYMRGLATDSLDDFARALQALDGSAKTVMATFNRALILEQLCDREAAAAEWRNYLAADDSSPWAAEAREHLSRDAARTASEELRGTPETLRAAVKSRDGERLRKLVDRDRFPARSLIERVLLPGWGEAWVCGDETAAKQFLDDADAIAAVLSRVPGEGMTVDAVAEIHDAVHRGPSRAGGLATALEAYGDGRRDIERIDYAQAMQHLDRSVRFAPAGSAAAALIAIQAVTARYYLYDFPGAEEVLNRASETYQSRSDRYRTLFGHIAWLRGLISVGRADDSGALPLYAAALATFESVGELENQARQHTNIASALSYLGETEQAAVHRHASLRLAQGIDSPLRLHAILSEATHAALAASLPSAALVFQDRLVRLARKSGHALQVADALITRSTVLEQSGRRHEALADLSEAERTVPRISDAPTRRRVLADLAAAEAFAYRDADDQRVMRCLTTAIDGLRGLHFPGKVAQLLLERGRARMRAGDLAGAEGDLRDGIAQLEEQRRQVKPANLRISYFDRAEALFSDLASVVLRHGHQQEAFDLLERARARELLDAVTRKPMTPLTAIEIQRRIAPDVVVVSQTVTHSALFLCVLSRSRLQVIERPGGEALLQPLVDRISGAFALSGALPKPVLRSLAAEIIDPLGELPAGTRIVFVPDRGLHRVPFAALPNARGRYLVEDHVVSVAPSATLYVSGSGGDCCAADTGAQSALLIASPEPPSGTDLPRLPRAVQETNAISRLYRRHCLILGSDAEAPSLLGIGGGYNVIHFAGHSVVDEQEPGASALLVGTAGRIRASDIEQSDLRRVRLVVLSGCSTGVGKTHPSEGVMSLARAFLAAGVPAVVGTVAPVDDTAASQLLIEFHRAYTAGMDPAAALRTAQLRMLANERPGFPGQTRWSAFEVVGGASAGSHR